MPDHAAPRPPHAPRRAPWAAPTRLRARAAWAVLGAIAIAGAVAPGGLAYPRRGQTERVSLLPDGSESEQAGLPYQLTPDGRYALFRYGFSNLPGAIFVRDLVARRTEQVDLADDGTPADGGSFKPSISDDGRFVAFISQATNLGVPDDNGLGIYLRDRLTGNTEGIPIPRLPGGEPLGVLGDGWPFISGDGRFVAFEVGPGPIEKSIALWDRETGTSTQIVGPPGAPKRPTLSADGRYVGFVTVAGLPTGLTNVTDTNGTWDAYVLDRVTGKTELASPFDPGSTSGQSSGSGAAGVTEWARISADGRYAVFVSESPRLIPEDRNRAADVFVRDLVNDRTERVSVKSDGAEGYGPPLGSRGPTISADGRYVVFMTTATFVPEDTPSPPFSDVYVHDRSTGATELVSVATGGQAADGDSAASVHTYVTADGSRVLFYSFSSNLVPGDFNRNYDAFVRDRGPAVGVAGMTAGVNGGEVTVSGSAAFSGDVVSAALDAPGAGLTNADLTGARVTYRREFGDLLVDLDLMSLSSAELNGETVPLNPQLVYLLRFVAGGTRYEVRAGWAADATPSGGGSTTYARHLFLLFRCDPNCLPVSSLTGGFGTTGPRIRVSVPLSLLGISEGAAITGVEAAAGRGHPATGTIDVPDTVTLPNGTVPVSTVRLGIVPTEAGEGDVVYGAPVSLVDASFSGGLSVSGWPPGAYAVWARACLGQQCGSASVPVTFS